MREVKIRAFRAGIVAVVVVLSGLLTMALAQSGNTIANLVVNDTANAADWSIQSNIKAGDKMFGDRDFTISTLPVELAGGDWIRTANDSKKYEDDPAATFTLTAPATVYVIHDNRITPGPSWLTSGYTLTSLTASDSGGCSYVIYSKSFAAGDVSLGSNGKTSGCNFYSVVVKPSAKPTSTAAVTPAPSANS